MRENICIDNGWQFREGDIEIPQSRFKHYMYDHAKTERAITGPAAVREYITNIAIMEDWETVDLPHDYVIRHTPEEKYNNTLGYLPYNNAWYKKKFSLSNEDREKRITLYFEGIATHATVYVNGCLMGHNYCGYTPFEIDITDVARPGEDNLVAVRVQAEEHEGWWYEGAGIYRHVWLTKTPLLCIERHGVFISPKRRGNTWDTEIKTEIRNEFFRDMGYELKITLSDAQGNEVAGCVLSGKAERKSVVTASTCLKVKSPKLWDTENPNMYTARVTLNGEDEITVRFGFREAVFDPDKGFFLNGKPVKIKGVCCHGDFGLTGKAVPDNILRYRIGLLREMGANGYRCAHYPHAEATMDALDENGFLVMAETRWFESTKEGLEQLSALIRRDRNHPSVIMWSLGNEEPYFGREQGKRIFARMYAEAKRLDPTRPVMCAVAGRTEQATIFDVSDIVGINYNLPSFDVLRQRYPDKCFLSSENCAVGTTRGYYIDGDQDMPLNGRIKSYDFTMSNWQTCREDTWKFIAARDRIAGGYQWAGIEHRGETKWPRLCSVSGALDMFLQKKDAFYQNMSLWRSESMVHLLPHWNFRGREGEEIRVVAYTNCPEVEFFLNGRSLGAQTVEKHGYAELYVPYEPGELKAVARCADGTMVTDVNITTGVPVALHLELLNGKDYRGEPLCANGKDMALVNCYAVDEAGNVVPDASPVVNFAASLPGKLIATGSDNTDHVPPFSAERRMYAGIIVAGLVITKPGKVKIYASSPGLESAVLEIEGK